MQWGKIFNRVLAFVLYSCFLTYFGLSIYELILQYNKGIGFDLVDLLMNAAVLIGELIGPIYATYFLIQLIDGMLKVNEVKYDVSKITNYPKVDILIPIHNVQPRLLQETLDGCKKINYPNFDVRVGDDHSENIYSESCREIVKEYGYKYYYGEERQFKSGVLNRLLEQSDAKYIFLIDADHIPESTIVEKFVAILEQYPKFSFVQAKFKFRNVSNLLHIWDCISYAQLFCAQAGKRMWKSVVFYGTSACFRREILYPLPEDKLSEDFDKTITITAAGHYGYWLDEVATSGLLPESFDHKMAQMFRWTAGQMGAIRDNFKYFIKSKMRIRQRIDFAMSSTMIMFLTAFYGVAFLYIAIYFMEIPTPRAGGINEFAFLVIPLLIGLVYFGTFLMAGLYSRKAQVYDFKFWHVGYFMLFGALIAPFLIISTIKGLLGYNKIHGPWPRAPGGPPWHRW